MKKTGFIFFNIQKVEGQAGVQKICKIIGLKTNEDLKLLSKFEKEINIENYRESIYDMFSCFEEWVKNPYEVKFITFNPNDMKGLIEACKQVHYKSKTRDFYKIISYQYWNIQNEMTYRMGIKREGASLEELLSIYGISFVGNKMVAKDLCFNTHVLATHFKLDAKRNNEVFIKPNHANKNKEKNERDFPVLSFSPIRGIGEVRLKEKMEEGWNISIECKAKGRGYGLTYEATASHMEASFEDGLRDMRFGVGKTLEELLDNLFKDESKNPYAQEKRAEYEQVFSANQN